MNKHFSSMARQAFSFLSGAGFHLTQSGELQLRYEDAQVFVTVEWDSRSGELEVFLGLQSLKNQAGGAFSLTDLLAMEGVYLTKHRMPFQVAEEGKLSSFLQKLAEEMQAHAQPALAGDRMFFRRLETFRRTRAQTYMREMEHRRARMEADVAWRKRELDRVIALYSSMEDHLTASEKAKLAYARQHQTR